MMPSPSPIINAWWIVCFALATYYAVVALIYWWQWRDLVLLLHAVVGISLMAVFGINITIRSGWLQDHIAPADLIVLQRLAYGPILAALGGLLDLYAAERSRRLSILAMLMLWHRRITDAD